MKLLRITVQGLPLFKEILDISFYAQQRVADDDKDLMFPLFSNVYLNCSNAFIGINAAGKTSVLKVILLALDVINNQPINHAATKDILGVTPQAVFNIYFSTNTKEICRLETVITTDLTSQDHPYYKIVDEKLWSKPQSSVIVRKNLTEFSSYEPVAIRNSDEMFLSDDVSIIIAQNKKNQENVEVINLLAFTNINILPPVKEIPVEIIRFLDPTIEKLYFESVENNSLIHLKFKGKKEVILNDIIYLEQYLSSGTIKGIVTFMLAKRVLKSGGYMVIDELENHFNKEIVSTLIRFFLDAKLNKNGGTLIFSTHYPELLDEYDRNDSIHIVRNKNGIFVDNLSTLLKRNDIKKSDAYQSGILEGTAPIYDAYIQLKKSIVDYLI